MSLNLSKPIAEMGGCRADGGLRTNSISASGDRTLRVWSAETGEELTQINAHNRGIASLDVDLETGTAVTGSSDWGIRLHQLSEWGFDFSSPYPSSSESESDSDLKGPKQEDRASFVKGKKTIEPEHPNGLEFVTAKQCCRDGGGMHHSRMASTSIGPGNEDGVNEEPGMGAGTRCYVCSHRGHKELVRSLWLGENVVLSGSYDHTIKVSTTLEIPVGSKLIAEVSQIWDRKTGVLLKDLPNLHAGRVFSVVGDRTKAVSTGLDQVSRHERDFPAFRANPDRDDLAAYNNLGLWVWTGYQFCRNVIVPHCHHRRIHHVHLCVSRDCLDSSHVIVASDFRSSARAFTWVDF